MTDHAAGFRAFVGGAEFTGRRFDRRPGFYVREVEGLLGGANVSPSSVPSLYGDGELDLPNRRDTARTIRLTGFVYAESMTDLGYALRQLDGILAASRDAEPFAWTEFGQSFHTMVRRGVSAPPQRRGKTGFADYTIRFRAPKQVYYGEAHEFTAGQNVIQHGTYPSRPLLQVTGAKADGYTITGPGGRRVVVVRPLVAGTPHLIDMRRGGLYENGVRQTSAISVYEPWAIDPDPVGVTHAITGGLSLNGVVYDAYT